MTKLDNPGDRQPDEAPLWVVLLCCALAAVCIAPALMCGGLLITN